MYTIPDVYITIDATARDGRVVLRCERGRVRWTTNPGPVDEDLENAPEEGPPRLRIRDAKRRQRVWAVLWQVTDEHLQELISSPRCIHRPDVTPARERAVWAISQTAADVLAVRQPGRHYLDGYQQFHGEVAPSQRDRREALRADRMEAARQEARRSAERAAKQARAECEEYIELTRRKTYMKALQEALKTLPPGARPS